LALETENAVLVIDEKKGRKIARELNIEIVGTLRILLVAKQKGVIPSVKDVIEKLHYHNFRFAKPIIEQILKEAGEA
jgi:predicted nucleic acid-binding protein